MEFQTPGFDMALSWSLWPSGELSQWTEHLSLSVSGTLPIKEINEKQKRKQQQQQQKPSNGQK